jgi:hypothetical protein
MKIVEVKNAEPTVVLEITKSELGTLVASFGITSGRERQEFANEMSLKTLPYAHPDMANEFYRQLLELYKKTF